MTKPKAKQPLDSFDPRMLQLLLAGARRRIIIPFEGPTGKARAHSFQRRLHTLRARMRQDDHEHWKLASRCYVRLLWGRKVVDEKLTTTSEGNYLLDDGGILGAFIVVQPMDMVFDDVLSKLDLSPLEAPPDISPEPTPTTNDEDLEKWLSTIAPDPLK